EDLGSLLFSIVEEQAVWACLAEGMTIRATADHLAMNKSQVGRIAKRIKRRDGTPDSRALFPAGSRHSRKDRKSTRLNSSHVSISYAVFCLKKKKNNRKSNHTRST